MSLFFEIGAYDGDTNSLTASLADSGWKGVYVEPIKEYADRCKERHKDNDVIVIQKACSDRTSEIILYGNGQVTTGSEDMIKCWPSYYLHKAGGVDWSHQTTVSTTTLTILMQEYGIPDLLVIDVEGMEYKILSACEPKPHIIIVETHEGDIRWFHQEWVRDNVRKIDSLFSGWSKTILDECNTRYESPDTNEA
jgi:FkbM family methyltransferase